MKIKKGLLTYLFALALLPFVSAAIDFRYGWSQLIQGAQEFLSPIFELLVGDYSGSEFFLAKCLMLILLFIVIRFVLIKSGIFGNNKGVVFIVAAVISILGIRFVPDNEFFSSMLIPYGTLAIALLTFLPLFIFFFFVYDSIPGTYARRLAWIIYGIAFAALTWVRINKGDLASSGEAIYLIGLASVVFCIVFDPWISHLMGLSKVSRIIAGIDMQSTNTDIARLTTIENTQGWQDIPSMVRERMAIIHRLERHGIRR